MIQNKTTTVRTKELLFKSPIGKSGLIVFIMIMTLSFLSCRGGEAEAKNTETQTTTADASAEAEAPAPAETAKEESTETKAPDTSKRPIVTFIELGSVDCVPCKMMKPVMEEVEKTYGDKVKVVFHDVWTDEGQPEGRKYGIRAIPTQIFLDADGKEFFRHEGFFPFEQLDQVLKQGGVK